MKMIINLKKSISKDVFSVLNGITSAISTFQQLMLQENIDRYVDDISKDVSQEKRDRFGLFEPTKKENKFFFMRKFNFSYGASHEITGGNFFDNRVITSFFYNNIDVRISTTFNLNLFTDFNDLKFISRNGGSILISISSEDIPDKDLDCLTKSIAKSISADSGFYKLNSESRHKDGEQWDFIAMKSDKSNGFEL